MTMKAAHARAVLNPILFLLLGFACSGQSRYNNQIQPGLNTRADVDHLLGAPVRALSPTSFEYQPPAGAARLLVEYHPNSNVVDHIEATFLKSYSRSAMLQALKLPEPQQPQTSVKDGKLMEFFAAPAFLTFTFAPNNGTRMVDSLGYYSPELFSKIFAPQPNQSPSSTSVPGPPGPVPSKSPVGGAPGSTTPSMASPAGSSAASSSKANQLPTSTSVASAPGSVPPKSSVHGASGPTPPPTPSTGNSPTASSSNQQPPMKKSTVPAVAPATDSGLLLPAGPAPYAGPSSGTIHWSGSLKKDELLTLNDLPGIPVMIDFDVRLFSVVEPPSPSNAWKRLVIRSKNQHDKLAVTVEWKTIQ